MRWDKYITYKKLKINSNSEIYKTMYHNSSYLLLFEKRKLLRSWDLGVFIKRNMVRLMVSILDVLL